MENRWMKTWMGVQETGANKKDTERGAEEKGQDVERQRPRQDPVCSTAAKETLSQPQPAAMGDSGAGPAPVGHDNGIATQTHSLKLRTFDRMKTWFTGSCDRRWMLLEEDIEEVILSTVLMG